MRRELARREFLVGRWLARRALATRVGCAPESLVFDAGPHGRPHIARPQHGENAPDVNWSHADGLVVCATAAHAIVGIDVEPVARRLPARRLDRFLSPAEFAALDALPEADRAARFWRLWTAKEAYLKARGTGIAGSLAAFTIQLHDPLAPQVIGIDDTDDWQMSEIATFPGFCCALAVWDPARAPIRVEVHRD